MKEYEEKEAERLIRAGDRDNFILVLFVFLLINIIVPDKEKSVQENRMLASAPKWNWGNVISGDYMEKFERYMSDQFVGRDFWRTIKVGVDRLAGVSKEHGVYIGKDGQLLEEIELPNQEYLADNLKSIQNFAETNTDLPVRMMLVPDAAGILEQSFRLWQKWRIRHSS